MPTGPGVEKASGGMNFSHAPIAGTIGRSLATSRCCGLSSVGQATVEQQSGEQGCGHDDCAGAAPAGAGVAVAGFVADLLLKGGVGVFELTEGAGAKGLSAGEVGDPFEGFVINGYRDALAVDIDC